MATGRLTSMTNAKGDVMTSPIALQGLLPKAVSVRRALMVTRATQLLLRPSCALRGAFAPLGTLVSPALHVFAATGPLFRLTPVVGVKLGLCKPASFARLER